MKSINAISLAALLTMATPATSMASSQIAPAKLTYVECHSDRGVVAKALVGDASISNEGHVHGWLITNLLNSVEVDCSPANRNRLRHLLKKQDGDHSTVNTSTETQIKTSAELCRNRKNMSIYVLNMGALIPLRLHCRSLVSAEFIRPAIDQLMSQVSEIDSSSSTAPLFLTNEQYTRIKPQLQWMKPSSPSRP